METLTALSNWLQTAPNSLFGLFLLVAIAIVLYYVLSILFGLGFVLFYFKPFKRQRKPTKLPRL